MRLLLLLVAAVALASCVRDVTAPTITPPALEPDTNTPDLTSATDLRALELKVDYLVDQASITYDRMDRAFLSPDELRAIVFPIPDSYQTLAGDGLLLAWLNGASVEGLAALRGVDDTLAARIAKARPFATVLDALRVGGLDTDVLDLMRLMTVS